METSRLLPNAAKSNKQLRSCISEALIPALFFSFSFLSFFKIYLMKMLCERIISS